MSGAGHVGRVPSCTCAEGRPHFDAFEGPIYPSYNELKSLFRFYTNTVVIAITYCRSADCKIVPPYEGLQGLQGGCSPAISRRSRLSIGRGFQSRADRQTPLQGTKMEATTIDYPQKPRGPTCKVDPDSSRFSDQGGILRVAPIIPGPEGAGRASGLRIRRVAERLISDDYTIGPCGAYALGRCSWAASIALGNIENRDAAEIGVDGLRLRNATAAQASGQARPAEQNPIPSLW